MNKNIDTELVIEMIEKGNRRGLARAITLIENGGEEKEVLLDYAYKKVPASTLVVGITGAGGAGKSTLIDKLIAEYRANGNTVGVIAVDPSSPFTGGAFLGDRVRMSNHNTDTGVFIRSFGSRNCLGGISEAAKNALYLYKAFGFDVIIVESIGIGQDETEISRFVDVNTLVLVPGLGDAMQMTKAGVRETAEMLIINKSDKPEAELLKEHLESSFGILPLESRPPIVSTIASDGIGIKEAVSEIGSIAEKQKAFADIKRRARIWAELNSSIWYLLHTKLQGPIKDMEEKIYQGNLTPFEASKKLVQCINYKED